MPSNSKRISYMELAHRPALAKKPYQYNEQLIHGRKLSDKVYSFREILAAWLDSHNVTYARFARDISAWSVRNGYITTVAPITIYNYLRGQCVPKSQIRDLIAAYTGMDDAFLTGYRATMLFEAKLEQRIVAESPVAPQMTSQPGRKVETRPSNVMVGPQAA